MKNPREMRNNEWMSQAVVQKKMLPGAKIIILTSSLKVYRELEDRGMILCIFTPIWRANNSKLHVCCLIPPIWVIYGNLMTPVLMGFRMSQFKGEKTLEDNKS